MAMTTAIEWTDRTFNPWTGCTKISPGCDNCYAEGWSKRSGIVRWGNNPRKRTTDAYWRAPIAWQKQSDAFFRKYRRKQRVFCASLADVFDNKVDPSWRVDLFEMIKKTPDLDWQLLTKRPQNIKKMLPEDWGDSGYNNVWLGFTAEDQERFDQRASVINEIPANVWFVSYEPAIGPLRISDSSPKPDWLIIGGESGHRARSMDPVWARDVIKDCRVHAIPAFFKQWGNFENNPMTGLQALTKKEQKELDPFGKGGGLVDGVIVREFPNMGKINIELREYLVQIN